jgi:hypothetical protein
LLKAPRWSIPSYALRGLHLAGDEMESDEHQKTIPGATIEELLRQIRFRRFLHQRFEFGLNILRAATQRGSYAIGAGFCPWLTVTPRGATCILLALCCPSHRHATSIPAMFNTPLTSRLPYCKCRVTYSSRVRNSTAFLH